LSLYSSKKLTDFPRTSICLYFSSVVQFSMTFARSEASIKGSLTWQLAYYTTLKSHCQHLFSVFYHFFVTFFNFSWLFPNTLTKRRFGLLSPHFYHISIYKNEVNFYWQMTKKSRCQSVGSLSSCILQLHIIK